MRAAGRPQDVGAGGLRVPGEAGPRAGAGGPVGGQGLAHHGAEPLPRRLQHPGERCRRTGKERGPDGPAPPSPPGTE